MTPEKELLVEQIMKGLDPVVVKLFKILNEKKKEYKKRSELLDYIKNTLPFLGLNEKEALFILELYLLNYRKDGNYSDLTKDNVIDPRKVMKRKTTNQLSSLYTKSKLPFKGSNLEAYWETDSKGNDIYVVISYGWYPVYIFKDDKWYEALDRYSSSTRKQMSYSNPIEYNTDLQEDVFLLTRDEMDMLRNGKSHDEIMKNKFEKLKKDEPELISKRVTSLNTWRGQERPPAKIKYKIKSINTQDGNAIITVDVIDVVQRLGQSDVQGTPNYLTGEFEGVTRDFVENQLKTKILLNLRKYVGKQFRGDSPENFIFNFNHLKK